MLTARQPVDGSKKSFLFHRLGEVKIHSGRQALRFVFPAGIGGQGYDGCHGRRGWQIADGPCGLKPVHYRHLHIHEYQIVGAVLNGLQRFLAIADSICVDPAQAKQADCPSSEHLAQMAS